MFEDSKYNESDIIMRSILENGTEEVPSGVWEGISDSLDKASKRKAVVLMWRRAAVGVSVAAALALGLILNHGGNGDIVPPSSDNEMIAVVERASDIHEEDPVQEVMIAQVREKAIPKTIRKEAVVPVSVKELRVHVADEDNEVDNAEPKAEPDTEKSQSPKEKKNLTYQYNKEYMPSEWEEVPGRERREKETSIVLSGLAGTNGTRSNAGSVGLLRQPSISTALPKTGIKETSTKSVYGIPLSFGAGVKIDFTDRWSVGVGLNYTYLTRRFYGSYTKVNEQGLIESTIQSDIRNSQHYVGLPVNLFYDIVDSRHVNFYAYAGGAVEKCLSDHYSLLETKIVHTEKVKGVQLSANLGIGVEFLLGNHLGMYIDPSVRYYFDNGQPSSIRTVQPLMLGFEMGLRVKL